MAATITPTLQGVPFDIFREFIQHFDVKCVLRLRSVSKYLYTLIDAKTFVKGLLPILHYKGASFDDFISAARHFEKNMIQERRLHLQSESPKNAPYQQLLQDYCAVVIPYVQKHVSVVKQHETECALRLYRILLQISQTPQVLSLPREVSTAILRDCTESKYWNVRLAAITVLSKFPLSPLAQCIFGYDQAKCFEFIFGTLLKRLDDANDFVLRRAWETLEEVSRFVPTVNDWLEDNAELVIDKFLGMLDLQHFLVPANVSYRDAIINSLPGLHESFFPPLDDEYAAKLERIACMAQLFNRQSRLHRETFIGERADRLTWLSAAFVGVCQQVFLRFKDGDVPLSNIGILDRLMNFALEILPTANYDGHVSVILKTEIVKAMKAGLDCMPDTCKRYSDKIVPLLVDFIKKEENYEVGFISIATLGEFLRSMGEDYEKFVPYNMEVFFTLDQRKIPLEYHKGVNYALGNIAMLASKAFEPYFGYTLNHLHFFN